MLYYVTKIIITVVLVILISEISKRSTFAGGIVASIPLVSVLAMIWLYIDTNDTAKVAALSHSILWFVIPSLSLFITLPILIKKGFSFYISLSVSIIITVISYYVIIAIVRKWTLKS